MQLYEHAPCGLLLTRSDGLIERANSTFCRWAGISSEDIAGVRFQDLLTMGGRIFHQTHFAPLLQIQGSVSEVKLDLVARGGPPVPVIVNACRHKHDDATWHMLAVFIAKDRHAYERELMASRRSAELLAETQKQIQGELREVARRKDEFLAMLAHEIRNPLAPIATSAQVLKRAAEDPERVRSLAGVIERQIGHLTTLVDDLLDVSRVTRGLITLHLEPINLGDVISAAIEQSRPLIDDRNQTFSIDIQPDIIVNGDRTRLVQVVVNLLNNAAKYTPKGGSIAIALAAVDSEARVEITDNGIGIEAALLPHIFDLFSQAERTPDRSQGGLGLGLALVRSLVALHAGSVEGHSDGAHRGSRFTLRFPTVDMAPSDLQSTPTSMLPTAQPLHVLIVDDNADAADTLADIVRFAGHSVEVAISAREAISHLARGFAPDICILDIGLPDMTGYELASAIRQSLVKAPPLMIALTGYGQTHDRELSLAAGFHHHLVKPAKPDELLALLVRAEGGVPGLSAGAR